MAQVHKAGLHDGKIVAVKVQHPKVQKQSSRDIVVIEVSVSAQLHEVRREHVPVDVVALRRHVGFTRPQPKRHIIPYPIRLSQKILWSEV